MLSFLIDENGKIFGKLNIVDLVIFIFFVSLLPMFFFGYSLYQKSTVKNYPTLLRSNVEFRTQVHCDFLELDEPLIEKINIGDQETDEKGRMIARIIQLEDPVSYQEVVDASQDFKLTLTSENLKQRRAILDTLVHRSNGRAVYKMSHRIMVGEIFPFKTHDYEVKCRVVKPFPQS